MKILKQIAYTGKNLNDVFALSCVKAVIKIDEKSVLVLWQDVVRGEKTIAHGGDLLVQYTNGTWSVE